MLSCLDVWTLPQENSSVLLWLLQVSCTFPRRLIHPGNNGISKPVSFHSVGLIWNDGLTGTTRNQNLSGFVPLGQSLVLLFPWPPAQGSAPQGHRHMAQASHGPVTHWSEKSLPKCPVFSQNRDKLRLAFCFFPHLKKYFEFEFSFLSGYQHFKTHHHSGCRALGQEHDTVLGNAILNAWLTPLNILCFFVLLSCLSNQKVPFVFIWAELLQQDALPKQARTHLSRQSRVFLITSSQNWSISDVQDLQFGETAVKQNLQVTTCSSNKDCL